VRGSDEMRLLVSRGEITADEAVDRLLDAGERQIEEHW
jgi:hypothetical protein